MGGGSIMFLAITGGCIDILLDDFNYPISFFNTLVLISVGIAFVLCWISFFVPEKPSGVLLNSSVILAFFTIPTFLMILLSVAYYLADVKKNSSQLIAAELTLLLLAMGAFYSLLSLKKLMVKTKFIEKEFRVDASRIVMRTPFKTELDVANDQFIGVMSKIVDLFKWKIVQVIAFIATFPLSYFLTRYSGETAEKFFLLTIVALPMANYILNSFVCCLYVRVITVWKLERQHGKPVVFGDVE